MSAAPSKPAQAAAPAAGAPPAPAGPKPYVPAKRPRVDWKAVWPIPLALAAAAALAGGLIVGVYRAPKDDPAIPLAQARAHYEAEEFTDALDVINHDLLTFINRGKMTEEQQKELFAIRARSLAFGQERAGIHLEANYIKIIEAYEQARKRGLVLEDSDISNLADAYLATGELAQAIDLARKLGGRDDIRQVRVYERIVLHHLKSGEKFIPEVLTLLGEMLEMPKLTTEQRAWVVARQTEIRLRSGFAQEAIARLLRDLPKFESLPREARAELMFLLGKAYSMDVDDDKAREYLALAQKDMNNFDERRGEALIIEGGIFAKLGENDQAKEKYTLALDGFKESTTQVKAVIGLAQAAFALGDSDQALDQYQQAIEILRKSGPQQGITLSGIGDMLNSHYEEKILKNDAADALRFAQRAEVAYKFAGAVPSLLQINLANANRQLADNLMREASGMTTGRVTPADVSPVTATQAKSYLLDAGAYFREHARSTVASNYEQSMDSLYNAGDCFDLAGDAPSAIEAFSSFLSGARDSYPNLAEVVFRLAQVHESKGDYITAAGFYERLIAQREGSGGDRGTAAWADRSIVPLARCYINEPRLAGVRAAEDNHKDDNHAEKPAADSSQPVVGKPNEERALELLKQVVAGRYGSPESMQMREAIVELGNLHYKRGEYREAIGQYIDFIARNADLAARNPSLMYKLADSYRLYAQYLSANIENESLTDRATIPASTEQFLQSARRYYQEVSKAVALRGGRASKLEKLYQRNATFYIGDCSYQLGDYEQAIQEYSRAREQYASDPSMLMAMVQSVAAFIRLERWEEAKNANEKAKGLLATIPDEVWNNPERLLPMERRHWEGWLASRLELDSRAEGIAAGSAPDSR